MKKFFGVVLTVMLCVCLMAPAAFAATEADAIVDGIVGVIEGAASGETSDILGDLGLGELNLEEFDLGEFDPAGMLGSFIEGEVADDEIDPQVKVEQALQDAQVSAEKEMGIDIDWLTTLLADSINTEAVNSFFAGFDSANLPDLLTVISEVFGDAGIDMANFDASALGNFDISTLIGGSTVSADETVKPQGTATQVASNDASMVTTDIVTGMMDGLKSGLQMVGLNPDELLATMGDNEIINFFANMYIGFIGEVEEPTDPAVSTTAPTTAPAPSKTPDTGDTASVAVAFATLCVAVAAAGVCLKKKED